MMRRIMEKQAVYKAGNRKPRIDFALGSILENLGLTQAQAAEKIGISRTAVVHMVAKPRGIRFETLARICVALDVEPSDLLKLIG